LSIVGYNINEKSVLLANVIINMEKT